jgi:hypothetical protein
MRKFVKNHLLLTGLFLTAALGLINPAARAEEDFAPKIIPPKNMQNRDMWINVIKQWVIPSKSEVGIPAYPGAHIVGLSPAGEMTANDEKYPTLPAITLAAVDERAEVTAFYKEKLKDWKYKNQFGMFDIFWTGRDDFNSMDITQSATTPNVIVMEASSGQTDFMPNAKTAITIVYKPVK